MYRTNAAKTANRRSNRIAQMAAIATLVIGAAVPAWAQPELTVQIDGQTINSPFNFVFPDTLFGEQRQLVVVLRNTGDEDLVFLEQPAIQMVSGFATSFQLVQPALEVGNKLSPNSSTAFAINIRPDVRANNALSARTFIYTNASAAPFNIGVRGQVIFPIIELRQDGNTLQDADQFDLGAVRVGETREVEFVIFNDGLADLNLLGNPPVSIVGSDAATMTVTQQPDAIVPPGLTTAFRVAFSPTEERPHAVDLQIATNAEIDQFDLALTAEGTIVDCDGNGVDDATEIADGSAEDCDGNGLPDVCDPDNDNDGLIDACDAFPTIADDLDSDNDGTPDIQDGCPNDANKLDPGTCGCGVADVDSDDDGTLDCDDAFPFDPHDGEDPQENENEDENDDENQNGNDNGGQDDDVDDNDREENDDDVYDDDREEDGVDNGNDNGHDEGRDDYDYGDEDLDVAPLLPAPCGFGALSATMMCTLSLAGVRIRTRKPTRRIER